MAKKSVPAFRISPIKAAVLDRMIETVETQLAVIQNQGLNHGHSYVLKNLGERDLLDMLTFIKSFRHA